MTKIFLGEGLDKLKFGMTKEEVKGILGEPDDVEEIEYEEDDDDISIVWHYDQLEISVSFDKDDEQWLLFSIASSAPETELAGKKLIGKTFEEAMEEIKNLNLGEIEIEQDEEDENLKQVFADESSISFWFDENILTEMQWGPIFED